MPRLKYVFEFDDSKVKDPEELALWPHPRLIYRWRIPAYYFPLPEKIVTGGFSEVRYYEHYRSLQKVAIKTMRLLFLPSWMEGKHPVADYQGVTIAEARREYNILVKLRECKRILQVIEAVVILTQKKFLLVTERGVLDTRQLLIAKTRTKRHDGCAGFPFYSAILLAAPIYEALAYIHAKGILHRDIKPENIFLDIMGVSKLADFGLARKMAGRTTTLGHRMGTAFYFAPEIWNFKRYSIASDMWAMSITFMELWGGNSKFQGDQEDAWLSLLSEMKDLSADDADAKVLHAFGYNDPKLTKREMYVETDQWQKSKEILKLLFRTDPASRVGAEDMKQIPEIARALKELVHYEEFRAFETKVAVEWFYSYAMLDKKLSLKADEQKKMSHNMPDDPIETSPTFATPSPPGDNKDLDSEIIEDIRKREFVTMTKSTDLISRSIKMFIPRLRTKSTQSRIKSSRGRGKQNSSSAGSSSSF